MGLRRDVKPIPIPAFPLKGKEASRAAEQAPLYSGAAYIVAMALRDPFVDYLLELLSPLGETSARRMFGGWGIYVDGLMAGIVAEETFYLKTDTQTRAVFEKSGSAPFVFEGRGRIVETSYWSAPEEAMDAPDAMRPWAQLALDAARRKPAAKPKRKRRLS